MAAQKLTVTPSSCSGIGIGRVALFEKEDLTPDIRHIHKDNAEAELARYHAAADEAAAQIEALATASPILKAHIGLLRDFALTDMVTGNIRNELMNAEEAFDAAVTQFIGVFEGTGNPYMMERVADLMDIRDRVLATLQGRSTARAALDIAEPVVLLADDLSPSDTVGLDAEKVAGFITRRGGPTSHVCILAKGMGLPALVGVGESADAISAGDLVVMDAAEGVIWIDPDEAVVREYTDKREYLRANQQAWLEEAHLPAVAKAGRQVLVCANIGHCDEIAQALEYHADGVGLFRSEFLYMAGDHFPTEEEQYDAYKKAALCGREVIVRTLDIGGDKALPYFEFPQEDNPFLGWRAIRISLELTDIFQTQLRALLRASAYGDIRIMYPMIVSVEELQAANALLRTCMKELEAEGVAYNPAIRTGVMIETPAAVICAPELAKEAHFFSIGTNDLTQYTLAADRGNPKTAAIYNPFHPAVLWSIRQVIGAGHEAGIPVGMCGDFASDIRAIPILLGMGLDEFSVPPACVPQVKHHVRASE